MKQHFWWIESLTWGGSNQVPALASWFRPYSFHGVGARVFVRPLVLVTLLWCACCPPHVVLATGAETLIIDVPASAQVPPPFIAGRRATARVMVSTHGLDHVANAPAEAFRRVAWRSEGLSTSVEIHANHVVRRQVTASGGDIRWTFLSAETAPWSAVLLERSSDGPFRVDIECVPHLDYIAKFLAKPPQQAEWQERGLIVTSPDHSELRAAVFTDARIVQSQVEDVRGGAMLATATLEFTGPMGYLLFTSGPSEVVAQIERTVDAAAISAELQRVVTTAATILDDGARLDTPDPALNAFARASRIWFHKGSRRLPFGPPWSTDATENQEIDVLTASPDYHGVFANDCVQTALEGMLVAPSLRPVYDTGLDTLYEHAKNCDGYIPEAVEFIFGKPEVFIQGIRIGQHPQWIAALASVVLLSGDAELGERLWPGVELALGYYVDSNGDGVNDWDQMAYPEQPDTTGYRGGMLYAQAKWVWAFDRAAELALYLRKPDAAAELAARRDQAQAALERAFARPDGYAVWLTPEGRHHEHQGHNMILPVALGVASPESARRAMATMTGPAVWLDPYGPLRANRGSGLAGGDRVWAFMRWNFVQALFADGQADGAAAHAGAWARQELAMGLSAPESFPTPITGITGQGYVWTAGRALRSLTVGLFGLQPMAEGLAVDPNMPTGWPRMSLSNVPYRGRLLSIEVMRGPEAARRLNGQPFSGPVVPAGKLRDGANRLEIVVE
ncbi:MAG: hypothetical protein FJ276_01000 [Planctomycetes bacterium]|nr:hypothetical protein [Planctomycetota bacterium]